MNHSARRYLPIAIIAVIMLTLFLVSNPAIVFSLFNPSQLLKNVQSDQTQQLGARDAPLTFEEANQLYRQFKADSGSRAGSALARQDKRFGLPLLFLSALESEFLRTNRHERQHARILLEQLARHRELSVAVERQAWGDLLKKIAKYRRLEDATFKRLLDRNDNRALTYRLDVFVIAAQSHGLPDWTIVELERIARDGRGSVRNTAIEAIATSGHHALAQTLIQTLTDHPIAPDTIAAAIDTETPPQLLRLLKDPAQTMDLRVGALERLARVREHPEIAGAGFSYAFQQEGRLLETAYSYYRRHGDRYASHIDVDWVPLFEQHFDGPKSLRFKVADKYRYLASGKREQRSAFLLRMLNGTDHQQHTAMLALSNQRDVSDAAHERIVALRKSAHPDVKHMANVYLSRVKRNSAPERAKRATTGILFWLAFLMPMLAALGWQAWFVAALLGRLSSGGKRAAVTVVCLFWLLFCLVLGTGMFIFLLGYGHGGGGIEFPVIGVIAALGVVVWGFGWILHRIVRGSNVAV